MTNTASDAGATFSAYILFSTPQHLNTGALGQAVLSQFPSLDLQPNSALDPARDMDTGGFVTEPLFMGASGADAAMVVLTRLPNYGTWDPDRIQPRQMVQCPDLKTRLTRNQSYLSVSATAADATPLAAFRAARLVSCIAAVLAGRDDALAVYWESGDHFLQPPTVVEMANIAASDRWPVQQWIGLSLGQDAAKGLSQAMSVGVVAFDGFEISFAAAPVALGEAARMVLTVASMALELGHAFADGHSLGAEGQAPENSYRLRHIAKGTRGANCDVLLLVHPQSPADHEALAGPLPERPDTAQTRTERGQSGYFQRMLRGQSTH